jgi:glycosyltransferase involved in cell wall biosynthesis
VIKTVIGRKLRSENIEVIKDEVRLMLEKEMLGKTVNAFRPDLVLSEGIFSALVAIHTVQDQVPVVTDVHSIVSAEYESNTCGGIVKEKAENLRDIEGEVFARSSRIVVVSDLMRSYIVERHRVSPGKVYTIPNGSDVRERVTTYSEPLRVIYGGAFAYYENIDSFLDLAKRNVTSLFYLAGDGPMKKHIFARMRSERINLHYLGYLKRDDCISYFLRMNVGVAPAVRTPNILRPAGSNTRFWRMGKACIQA